MVQRLSRKIGVNHMSDNLMHSPQRSFVVAVLLHDMLLLSLQLSKRMSVELPS